MLEYITYKKVKKHRAEKAAAEDAKMAAQADVDAQSTHSQQRTSSFTPTATASTSRQRHSDDEPPLSPVLDKRDEAWLKEILSDDGPAPPLPPRVNTPQFDLSSASESEIEFAKSFQPTKGKEKDKDSKKDKKDKKAKDKEEKQPGRISALFTRHKKHSDGLKPADAAEDADAEREKTDLGNVLDRLNLQAKNNKVLSLSNESSDLLQRFTNVFKDLVNGVPTACNDLAGLVEDRDGAINRGFEKLPTSLQKLVTQLPDKLTSSLAPELLAAAAESQGLKTDKDKNFKDAAMGLLKPQNLTDLATKPGALVGMLKAIVNALKVRWPAFIGTNVLWSVALFLLMFVLWYCHKRGREVRLEQEKSTSESPIDGSSRIEELPDDPLLPAPEAPHTIHRRPVGAPSIREPVSPLSDGPPSPVREYEPAMSSRR